MKSIILLMLFLPTLLMAQEKYATIYLKSGYIAAGEVIQMRRGFVRFKAISGPDSSETKRYRESHPAQAFLEGRLLW